MMTLVWLEHIVAQTEAGVEEGFVILVGRVQVLQQPKRTSAVEIVQSGFYVTPRRGRFLCGHSQFVLINQLALGEADFPNVLQLLFKILLGVVDQFFSPSLRY